VSSPTLNLPGSILVARQPIFDKELEVFAYELLFRSGDKNIAGVTDGNSASSQVMINAFLEIGIDTISGGRVCFVNLTRDFIVGQLPLPFPPSICVIEILEDIQVDEELLTSIKSFTDKGFTVALDDYVFEKDKMPLFELIDIVKIDIMACDQDLLEDNVNQLKTRNVRLLAEKVETREEFELCKSLGFDYFQGYFISKPVVIKGVDLKPSRIALLKVLTMLEDPDCDIDVLEGLISRDVVLSYKLLRIISSPYFGFRREITSIKHAVVTLGLKAIRDWFVVIALTNIDDKPNELILMTLQRAAMMKSLSKDFQVNSDVAFTTGLFSLIDAIMDQPMSTILNALSLSKDITSALIAGEGSLGELLTTVILYERGRWEELEHSQDGSDEFGTHYLEAVNWANSLIRTV
jgi:EAL and modified HD-GYP domain-containing signal transduction protein|tara:strand:+ start:1970 stop:3190 length:1221 start_codon:yes stop_codon:yes gene_type:complete